MGEEKAERIKGKKKSDELETVTFELQPHVPVQGDIKMECNDKQMTFAWCFNTAFVASQWTPEGPYTLILQQREVDKAIKDKQNKIFPKGFYIEVVFGMMENDIAEQSTVYQKHVQHVESNSNDDENKQKQSQSASNRYSDIVAQFPSLNNY